MWILTIVKTYSMHHIVYTSTNDYTVYILLNPVEHARSFCKTASSNGKLPLFSENMN